MVTSLKKLLKFVSGWTGLLSIRLRLTLLFVLVFGSTLVVFGFLTLDFLSKALEKEFDDALYNYAVDISESVTLSASGDLAVVTPNVDRQKIYPFSFGTALIQLRSISGEILTQVGDFGNLQIPFKRDFKLLEKGEEVTFRTLNALEGLPSAEAEAYRVVNFPIDNSPVPQLVLQVAVPLTFLERQIHSRKYFLEFLIPLIIIVATLGGYFLSTRALKPVTEIIKKAHDIEAQNLSERLPVPLAKDEVHNLATTLNEMLGRIEKSFQSQERFIADASHQLLTPLTIMKGELEAQLKREPAPLLESLHQEVDHLISLTKNMLLLARADAGISGLQFSNVFFEDIILESIARAEKLAKEKSIKLTFNMNSELAENSDRPQIRADDDLLMNAIFNLIENAIKYSPPGETVGVELVWKAKTQVLSIKDQGPGVPDEKKDLIFQRFTRATSQSPGYGLGLAIAQKIAELHEAKLWAQNSVTSGNQTEKGALFQFEIKNI